MMMLPMKVCVSSPSHCASVRVPNIWINRFRFSHSTYVHSLCIDIIAECFERAFMSGIYHYNYNVGPTMLTLFRCMYFWGRIWKRVRIVRSCHSFGRTAYIEMKYKISALIVYVHALKVIIWKIILSCINYVAVFVFGIASWAIRVRSRITCVRLISEGSWMRCLLYEIIKFI